MTSSTESRAFHMDEHPETRRAAATTRLSMPGGRSIPPRRLPGIPHSSGRACVVEKRLYCGPGFATVLSP